jgi:hypothetical protein
MNKKLVILPGGGDPENEIYKQVYSVIINYAKAVGYNEIEIKKWKGHLSNPEVGNLDMNEATDSAIHFFEKLENEGNQYNVICRSFGTGVFLNVCQKTILNKIEFASLWGIPTYTSFYELFKEKPADGIVKAKSKGLNIDESFFESVVPFDLLLRRYDQKFRLNIVNGSEDIYSPPAFHNYLKAIKSEPNIFYSLVDGPHEIQYYHQEYLEKIFSIS